ncbi:MAG: hypothetical protein ACPG8W_06755 [Candidatus Promineifilaceae bacterium]
MFRKELWIVVAALLLLFTLRINGAQAAPWPTPTPNRSNPNQWQPSPTPSWQRNNNQGQPAPTDWWQPTPTPWWNKTPVPTATSRWNADNSQSPQATATPSWNPANNQQPEPQATATAVPETGPSNRTVVTVHDQVKMPGAKRLGINIGAYDQYGAAQYMRNLIPNPGFESAEFAMLILTGPGTTPTKIVPNRWGGMHNGHPSGFWDGALYEVISGPNRGKTGRVTAFQNNNGNYSFHLGGGNQQFGDKDAVIFRTELDGYFTETPTRFHSPDTQEKRPGSPGIQALRLEESGWDPSFAVPFDSFARDGDNTAGKLNIVEGLWKFELWVKPSAPNQTIEVKFLRHRETEFFNETFQLRQGWQKIERKFKVEKGVDKQIPYDVNPLGFEVRVASQDSHVWIDDVELARVDNHYDTAFSDRFINLLRELGPGVIRDWGHQLGSSLDNQLASPWERKTNDFNPRDREPVKFHYSIHEFLELNQATNSEPWYVIPPTWTAGELQNLIAYLAAPAGSHPYATKRAELGQSAPWTSVFPKIHLEFGNEMWGGNTAGDPFVGATLWDGYQVGEVVGQRVSIMKASPFYQSSKLNLIIGGQAGFPGRQAEIQSKSTSHDSVGVAPYFARDIRSYGDDSQMYLPYFANPWHNISENGKMRQSANHMKANGRDTNLVIYEISSHLTHGTLDIERRNTFLTGLNMGISLPLHMLHYQADLGVREQAAFTALQYSWLLPGRYQERARLWGLLRDSESTQRKRPGWLGIELANQAIRGDVLRTQQNANAPSWTQAPINDIPSEIEVPFVQSFAFKARNTGYSVVLFNLDLYKSQTVDLKLPFVPQGNATVRTLTGDSIRSNNENGTNVKIVTKQQYFGQNQTIVLPKHSMVVIDWSGR